MFIQTEITPNPLSLKFIPGNILVDMPLDFPNKSSAQTSPLAARLFTVAGVDSIFIGKDFITVTKTDPADWYTLKPSIIGIIMEFLVNNKPILSDAPPKSGALPDPSTVEGEDKEAIKQILILLEEKIRPAVAQDGGDITLEKFVDGIVFVRLIGACSGCPSSTMTLKSGIENMLKYYIPDVKEVRSI